MRRREFVGLLGGLTATCPLRVLAQQGERIRYIAIMMGLAENDTETQARLVKFKNEMEKLGWSEGRNLRIQIRYAPAGAQATEVAKELTHRDLILALAAKHKLPAVYPFRLFVTLGGLMSYGTDQIEMFGQTATYVDQILRGANPAELPVQTPTKYETTLNLKTAKALGLTVSSGLLVAADEVIE
jgi:hypothetical protein